ncbi:hypothetical protein BX83_03390 [Escherichia coli O157:H7 str. 2010C-4979C1]|nr:hypothetical protein BX83_03390 [Escherichia coli O157:H7 str. 2010C-4979C1]
MVSRRVQALLDQLRAQGIQDEQVLNALAAVPREKFVDEAFEQKAWDNIALPIGQGQTISQPYMVARMTELLELTPQSRVLEIGTGSGYQTAILAHLVQHVCSVERIKGLQWQARRRLKNLDLHNVSTRHGDGWQGWQARAPFDAIIVTAAPPEIPTALARLAFFFCLGSLCFCRLDKTRQRPTRQFASYVFIILRTSCTNSSCSSALKRPKNSSSTLSPIGIAAASIFSPSAVSQTKRRRLSAASCSRLTKPRFSILANISANVALVLTAASISATCSIPGLSAMARITAYCGLVRSGNSCCQRAVCC